MKIEFDLDKRAKALAERGLDFARAGELFAGRYFTAKDTREDYGEPRFIMVGRLEVVFARRGAPHHQHEES